MPLYSQVVRTLHISLLYLRYQHGNATKALMCPVHFLLTILKCLTALWETWYFIGVSRLTRIVPRPTLRVNYFPLRTEASSSVSRTSDPIPGGFSRILMRYYVYLISKSPGEISFGCVRLNASALRRRYYTVRIWPLSATVVSLHDPKLSWDEIREASFVTDTRSNSLRSRMQPSRV